MAQPNWVYAAGAGGVFIAYTLYSRTRKAKAPKVAAATGSTQQVIPASSYGSDVRPELQNIEQTLATLVKNATGATAPAAGFVASGGNQVRYGDGYLPDASSPSKEYTPVSSSGHSYVWQTPAQIAATPRETWSKYFYQPTPGVFVPNASPGSLQAFTPLFKQVS